MLASRIKKITSKLILTIGVLVFLFSQALILATPAKAVVSDKTLGDFQEAFADGKYNKESFDFQSLNGLTASMATLLIGCVNQKCKDSGIRQGAVFSLGDTIASLYDYPPASGIYYAMDVASNLHIIKPAYAQTGIGFNVLSPFLDLWRAIRNLTYVLFVIGIVALGLMIMFRTRISPQATMTVQAALPRIIVALIMITFSYAIVGLIFDLMYVVFAIIVWGFQGAGIPGYDPGDQFNQFVNADFGNTTSFIMGQGFQGVKDLLGGAVGGNIGSIGVGVGLATIITVALAIIFPAVAGALTVALVPLVLGLAIAIIAFLVRTLIVLARAYLTLLINLIFAPIIILWSALTGRSVWEGWLKPVVANASVFLAVGIVIFFVNLIISVIDVTINAGRVVFGPPYLGSQHTVLKGVIALGAVVVLPQIPDIINQLLGIRFPQVQLPGGQLAARYSQGVSERLGRTGFARAPGEDWRSGIRFEWLRRLLT